MSCNNLFSHEFVTYEELYEAYLDCRKTKRSSLDALEFELNENQNLYKLWVDLNTMMYQIGPSFGFIVTHPVPREVFAAQYRDRIVHHLLCIRLNKYFEEYVIDDTYSCRKGKGTLYGVNRLVEKLKETTNNYSETVYVVRGDISGFFISISKNILFDKIYPLIDNNYEGKDREWMLWLTKLILFNEPQNGFIKKSPLEKWEIIPTHKLLIYAKKEHGLPVGNLPSQIWTTIYLTNFDNKSLSYPKILGYGRYVDDFFAIFKTENECKEYTKWCEEQLKAEELTLNLIKTKILSSNEPIEFIGTILSKGIRTITQRTKNNLWKNIHYFNELKIESIKDINDKIIPKLNSSFGYLKWFDEYELKKTIVSSNIFKRYQKLLKFNEELSKFRVLKKTDKLTQFQYNLIH